MDPIEVVSWNFENFVEGAVRVRVVKERLFKMRHLSVEYVEVGGIFIYSMDHGLYGGLFVFQMALTSVV